MFKDSRQLDRNRTAVSFDQALHVYADKAEKFFDGTIGSVDRRLSHCVRLLHSVRSTVARLSQTDSLHYLHAAEDLTRDRRALEALREDMLTGASNREDVSGLPGWRTASKSTQQEPSLPGADRRWVELEAAKFVAGNPDALDDSQELSLRAAHHAEVQTSTYTPVRSQAVTRAFVAKVGELGRRSYVPRTARTASVAPDIEAEAMFL